MKTLAALLFAIGGSLAAKVLASLGMSVVVFTGVDLVSTQLINQVQSGWGGLPGAVLGIAGLAGAPQGLGLMLGAFSTRVTLWAATSATRWVVS